MNSMAYQDTGERRQALAQVKRVVVKVGTRLLTDVKDVAEGQRVQELVLQLALLRQRGLEVILVSSGAIGAGMAILGTTRRPKAVPELQAHAAVGQCRLMSLYESACTPHGFHCAQLLLTAEDVHDHHRHLNVSQCLNELLTRGVLPVINENDSVSVAEIKFGDNDTLAALVATMIRADLTILLTTIDGLHERTAEGLGKRLSVVASVTPKIKAMAGGTDGNQLSTGGMVTKLRAAQLVNRAGEALVIADGRDFAVLEQVLAAADVGTLFMPSRGTRMAAHKRYLAFFSEPTGEITIDAGAERALCEGGRSLLPSGVRDVTGDFRRGATVVIRSLDGQEIAKGVSNYAAAELERIRGKRSAEVLKLLGNDAYEEVVHRSHLVLTSADEEGS